MKQNDLRIGERVYCDNFSHFGTIVGLSVDSVGAVVDYKEDDGTPHRVYSYMLSKI